MKKKKDRKHSTASYIEAGNDGRGGNRLLHGPDPSKSEEVCTDEQSLLEALFNSVPGLLYIYTEDGRLVGWNRQHEHVTGYTSDELMNFRAEDWFDEEDRITLAREWPKVFSEGYVSAEMKLTLRDGRRVPYFFTASRVMISGRPHMVGIGIDVSEKKRQDEALRMSENIFKKAEEVASMGSWYLDVVKNQLFWSDEVYRIFGMDRQSPLTYEKFLAVVHPDDRAYVDSSWEAALKRAPYDIDHRIVVDGTVTWVHEKAEVEFDEAGNPVAGIGIVHDITGRKIAEEEKEQALNEVRRLKELLEAENAYLKKEMGGPFTYDDIVGESDAMRYVLFRARQVARTGATVLVSGETGTGKGRIARLIHQESKRKNRPMVMVNCAGLPGNLIESELFGREKGAFTGAEAKQIGRFELADGGTIFLDEIAELPVELQAKLLRVIEDGEFERLGSPHTIEVDVRIIASTNRNLREQISTGRFREDLFYRLNVFPLTVPPLRQRSEDIPLLVSYFSEKFSKQYGKKITEIPGEAMQALKAHAWPGNVRELMGVVERAVIVSSGPWLTLADSIAAEEAVTDREEQNERDLAAVEKDHIVRTLGETGWKIEGPNGAARLLGLHPSTLRNRMKKLGIKRQDFI